MTEVSLRGVSRVYESVGGEVWAVRAVDLAIPSGTFVGLYGVSGSGKSTLLNLVAGLDRPTSGEVKVGGADLAGLSEDACGRMRLEHVGVVFQDDNLVEEFTAEENVMLPLEVLGASVAQARAAARAQLVRVGLEGLEGRYPAQMSGGQQQRVGIARALVGERRLLLADEPSGALDSRTSRDLFTLLRRLADEGATIVVATHDPIVGEFADVAYEMTDGRLSDRALVP